jgi:hypothetical protein
MPAEMGVASMRGTFIIDGDAIIALGKRPMAIPSPPIFIVFYCLSLIS